MQRGPEESSVQFSDRVKAIISTTAGLKNLSWDGYLKNYRPTREKQDKMRLETRQEYLEQLSQKLKGLKDDSYYGGSDCESDVSTPILPEKDYLPDWLDEDERTTIQNELLQVPCENSGLSFDSRLSQSRENLGKKFRELRETFSPKPSTRI